MPEPIIRIMNLCKNFQGSDGEIKALEDISLDIMQGEIFGIIGMSGAGKSTLVRCMNLLEQPTSGTVIFGDDDLSLLKRKELYKARRSIGMIFQQFNLLMQRTALDNVCFPLEIGGMDKKASRLQAEKLLELVGISEKAKAYPAQLSGGQRQRVAIARALATNPRVLLCDEATSALDPSTTHGVLALLKGINKRLGITIVIITHEMSVIEQICERVAIIDESRIVEIGTVRDIFKRPKTAAARRLVYPGDSGYEGFSGGRCCRIVFDGSSSFEPIIASMILEFNQPVNILFADTKNIDGRAFGQIVVQLPEGGGVGDRMIQYLISKGISAEEANGYV
jgi:D-methionine transport system ATP-binding protein